MSLNDAKYEQWFLWKPHNYLHHMFVTSAQEAAVTYPHDVDALVLTNLF